ncbi:MAG: DUF4386 domain-containing protein [Lewinellaceae bacterium]|nr:DUF4386 domain-containing protein [Lewinellaceae bacterium]
MNKQEKKAGVIAGISLIIMAIAAGFSYGFAQNKLVHESAEMMRQNLLEHKQLFLAALVGWILIFITDLVVSGALYILFRNNLPRISAITAIIRIGYTFILGVAIYHLIGIVPLLKGFATSFEISAEFASFEKTWSAGLILFGFHLLGLGYLSMKSRFIPGFLAYLLYIAGIGYILVHGAKQFAFLSAQVIASAENILALPMALSEILLAALLIYKGFKKNTN